MFTGEHSIQVFHDQNNVLENELHFYINPGNVKIKNCFISPNRVVVPLGMAFMVKLYMLDSTFSFSNIKDPVKRFGIGFTSNINHIAFRIIDTQPGASKDGSGSSAAAASNTDATGKKKPNKMNKAECFYPILAIPSATGNFIVDIQINGKKIYNSPLRITVVDSDVYEGMPFSNSNSQVPVAYSPSHRSESPRSAANYNSNNNESHNNGLLRDEPTYEEEFEGEEDLVLIDLRNFEKNAVDLDMLEKYLVKYHIHRSARDQTTRRQRGTLTHENMHDDDDDDNERDDNHNDSRYDNDNDDDIDDEDDGFVQNDEGDEDDVEDRRGRAAEEEEEEEYEDEAFGQHGAYNQAASRHSSNNKHHH